MKQRRLQRAQAAAGDRLPIRRRLFDKAQQRNSKLTSRKAQCNFVKMPSAERRAESASQKPMSTIATAAAAAAGPTSYSCAQCEQQIRDRYLLHACDRFWHNDCLKCDRCQAKLGELGPTLFEKDQMKLCRQDYFEMFGHKAMCSICDKLIYASEMVMRAQQNVYHLECFACQLCGLRFCVGDRFHLFENKIVCQFDYDEHILPIQESMQLQQQQQSHGPPPPPPQQQQQHQDEAAIALGDDGPEIGEGQPPKARQGDSEEAGLKLADGESVESKHDCEEAARLN